MSDQNAIKEFPIMAVNDSTDGEVKSVTNTLDKLHMQRPKKKFSMTDFNDSQRLLAKKVLTHWKSTIEAHDKMRQENPTFTGKHFRKVPKTGVIYATSRAVEMGYHPDAPDWANMGQGAPECGTLPNQPERLTSVEFDIEHQEYAPVQGLPELCEAVAEHYNQLYRMDSTSKYTKDNVCIIPGGRAGITRVMACLNSLNVGYGVPDYTAYEELLGLFKRINPIPIAKDKGATHVTPAQLEQQILQLGLGGVMVSNPCNPTGHLLEGRELAEWIDVGRRTDCLLIMDEFYSHYIYSEVEGEDLRTVSSAEYVVDVNKDPVIVIDGLTKNWRCPGWRVCWCVGPKELMRKVASAASYLDGGAANPMQKAAIPMLADMDWIRADIKSLQAHFKMKRDIFLEGILKLGITVDFIPEGTFYVWGNIAKLPKPLNDGITFFEEMLKEKLICVSGVSFDLNPGSRRHFSMSPYANYVRFSYGPELKNLQMGLKAIERVVNKFAAINRQEGDTD